MSTKLKPDPARGAELRQIDTRTAEGNPYFEPRRASLNTPTPAELHERTWGSTPVPLPRELLATLVELQVGQAARASVGPRDRDAMRRLSGRVAEGLGIALAGSGEYGGPLTAAEAAVQPLPGAKPLIQRVPGDTLTGMQAVRLEDVPGYTEQAPVVPEPSEQTPPPSEG